MSESATVQFVLERRLMDALRSKTVSIPLSRLVQMLNENPYYPKVTKEQVEQTLQAWKKAGMAYDHGTSHCWSYRRNPTITFEQYLKKIAEH